jgi:hypothetical protein
MKSYSKFLLFIVVLAAVVLPTMIKGPSGKPIMNFSDWLPSDTDLAGAVTKVKTMGESISRRARQTIDSVTGEGVDNSPATAGQVDDVAPLGSNQMYKWKDKHGIWQFSNQKPVDGSTVQVVSLPNVKNVMNAPVAQRKNNSSIGLPDGLSLDNAGELLKKMGLSTEQQESR